MTEPSHSEPDSHSYFDVPQTLLRRDRLAPPGSYPDWSAGQWDAPTVSERLDRLADPAERTPYEVAGTPDAPDFAARASSCPDLFLIDAADPAGAAATITRQAVAKGQRVLILTDRADELESLTRLLDGIEFARVVDASEPSTHPRTTLALARDERTEWRAKLTARLAAIQRFERQVADLDHEFAARTGQVAGEVEASDVVRGLLAALAEHEAAIRTADDQRAAVQQELDELKQKAEAGLGGFFKKMFGSGQADDAVRTLDAKLAGIHAEVAERNQARTTLAEQLRATRDRLTLMASETLRADREARVATLEAELEPSDPSDSGTGRLTRDPVRLTAILAELDDKPLVLSRHRAAALRAVLARPAAVGHDPLLTATHPEVIPLFDRLVLLDAQHLPAVGHLAPAWVLLGDSTAAGLFADQWALRHASPFRREAGRLVARLLPIAVTHREPLIGRPDIELRFADGDLVEVVFPPGTSLAEASQFLAAEAGFEFVPDATCRTAFAR